MKRSKQRLLFSKKSTRNQIYKGIIQEQTLDLSQRHLLPSDILLSIFQFLSNTNVIDWCTLLSKKCNILLDKQDSLLPQQRNSMQAKLFVLPTAEEHQSFLFHVHQECERLSSQIQQLSTKEVSMFYWIQVARSDALWIPRYLQLIQLYPYSTIAKKCGQKQQQLQYWRQFQHVLQMWNAHYSPGRVILSGFFPPNESLEQTTSVSGYKYVYCGKEKLLQTKCGRSLQKVKCVLVGDCSVGKTTTLIRLAHDTYYDDYLPQVFDTFVLRRKSTDFHGFGTTPSSSSKQEKVHVTEITLVDTAGQDTYDRFRPLLYKDAQVFLICFTVNNPNSFKHVAEKWISEVRVHQKYAQCILLGLRSDLRDAKYWKNEERRTRFGWYISKTEGDEMAKRLQCLAYFECCSTSSDGKLNRRNEIITAIQNAGQIHDAMMQKNKCYVQ